MNHIGTLTEKSLHAGLKTYLAQDGDEFECKLGRYVIDIKRGDVLLEIQTRNFSKIRRKLENLVEKYTVRLIYPIAEIKWIVKWEELDKLDIGEPLSRRKSPKKGKLFDVFRELVYIPHLIDHPNFTLEILLTHQEEIRVNDGQGSWRRKGWSLHDHRLLEVVAHHKFTGLTDFAALLPADLPEAFTTKDLRKSLKITPATAQKTAYALREMGVITQVGKRGNAYLYSRNVR
ncbi:MAG: hypothetical protein RLP44_10805 [Aggregatilineales bacterium]